MYKIGLIGAGNMGGAIIKGLVGPNTVSPDNIKIFDVIDEKSTELCSETKAIKATSIKDAVLGAKIVIPAVKPVYLLKVLDNIKEYLTNDMIIVSIAAGVSKKMISDTIGNKCNVVRTMPNTPALIKEGVTGICSNHELNDKDYNIVKDILSSLGTVIDIDEKNIDALTAISGSGPAYVDMFIEALTDGGVLMGLPRDTALELACKTLVGAAKMVQELNLTPGELKNMVSSPGGTTIEAIYTLEKHGFRGAVMEAVKNCAEKSKKMG